ncbi:MAG: low affinity iron permease family protein [Alphaproteobacteria bacterium]|nr:MAG: low affinity iron permease family protein [Alphaproteobacteria bacterium]
MHNHKPRDHRTPPPSRFDRVARWTERQVGRPAAFALALLTVTLWAATGPLFGWSDTWQLVINTGTTIVTFLMVFIIQSTQNRDTQALQLKLDELIRVNRAARNSLIDLEERSETEVDKVKSGFDALASGRTRRDRGADGK